MDNNPQRTFSMVIDRKNGVSLQKIADKWGVSRERVRQLIERHERYTIWGPKKLYQDYINQWEQYQRCDR
jgi:predicted DNA-binding protein YlxM (UPF0122 family)